MSFIQKLKIKIGEFYLYNIKYKINSLLSQRYREQFKEFKNTKKAIITLLPTHGNLGDHAIGMASKEYVKKYFPEYHIIEVEIADTYKYAKAFRHFMNDDDLVFIIGGGNMGSLYENEELTRRYIINTFKSFKVIQLPATVHFENNSKGKSELKISRRVYNSHPNLTLIARDTFSFNKMKEFFPKCHIMQNPDMVLFTMSDVEYGNRTGIKICLRNDKESSISPTFRTELSETIMKLYDNVTSFDTVINKRVDLTNRENELEELWMVVRSSEVVITDRLHGMIFCAITKTPCIVLPTFDHKVKEGFENLKDLNYIKYIASPSIQSIIETLNELRNLKNKNHVDFDNLYFYNLRKAISV